MNPRHLRRALCAASLLALSTARAAIVTSTWTNAANGNWNVAGNWTNVPAQGGFPNNNNGGVPTYDAVIDVAGPAYTVTLNTAITVEDLLLSSANATLNHTAGVFAATGALSISTGRYQLSGGEISNTAINLSGTGSFVFTSGGGILSNGTVLNGDLNLANPSASVRLLSGATFTGVANLSTSSATLAIQDTRTLTGKTINMDGASARFAIDGNNTVTFGAGTLLRGRGTAGSAVFVSGGSGLVNQGTIRADLAGQTLTINPDVFTNSAAGVVEAINGSTLTISASSWSNTGTIAATGSSAVNLGGTFTDPGTVNTSTGGVANITGTWNNSGNYIFPGTGSLTLVGGTINGGQITPTGGKTLRFTSSGGILSGGALFNGTVNLDSPSAIVRFFSGATFSGVANLSTSSSTLVIQDTQTLTGKTVNMDGASARFAIDGNNTVTLGLGTQVRGRGTLGGAVFVGGTNGLINQGTIRADLSGQTLTISPATFTNSAAGVVEAINNGTLTISATSWSSTGAINAASSAAVNLGGTFTNPGVVNTSTGGAVNITGTWNNAGDYTFPGTGSLTLVGGTINGGQITPTGGRTLLFTSSGGILGNGAVFNGDLNLTAPSASVRLFTGATFTGVANLSTSSSTLVIQDTQTLTGKTVNMDGVSARLAIDGNNTVTFGAGTLVRGRGALGGAVFVGGTNGLINQGTIRADLTGQTLTVTPSVFTNSTAGVVEAINASTLTIDATNWSSTGAINAASSAAVNLGGTFTNPGAVNTSTGGTVNVTGTWNNSGDYTFPGTGSLRLVGGTINGGQITPIGGRTLLFTSSGGILGNGAVFNGDLNLTAPSASVRLFTGATFTGVANLSTSSSTLVIQDTQTLTGKTVNMDGVSARLAIDGNNTVTLGLGTQVRGRGALGGAVFVGGTNGLINQGIIRADLTGQTLTVTPSVFTNSTAGVVEAINASTLTIDATNWTNAGMIKATGGSTVSFAGNWSNATGSAIVDATSILNLGGTSTLAGVGAIDNSAGGTVNITGTINNIGTNLNFNATTGSYRLVGGTISGGQITPGSGRTLLFTSSSGILSNGALFNGDLNLAAPSSIVRLQTGATFSSVANLSTSSSTLVIQDTQTLTGKTVNMDGASARLAIDGNNTVTFGAGTLVRGRGALGGAVFVGGTNGLINQGTIRADLTGQTLDITPTTFTNSAAGVVEAINGSILTISATNWSNAGTINATGSAAVNLASTLTNPGVVNTSTGGTVNVIGTWNNSGNYTFPGTGSLRLLGGTINGGQLTPGASGQRLIFTSSGGFLSNGVVLNGDLNLDSPSASVRLLSGASFTGAANLSSASATLVIQETRTLTGLTFNLDGQSARLAIDGSNTVTLGTGTLVRGRGALGGAVFVGGTSGLTNQGTIRADLPGQTLTVNPDGFSQQGTLEAVSSATLSVPAGYIQTAGITRLNNGTINTNPGTSIVIVAGSLEGRGIVNSNVANSATLSPGFSAGALSIAGDLSLTASSVIRIEIGGMVQGTQYDLLSEAGTIPLTLAGTLNVSFLNGFESTVQIGNTFTVITSNQAIAGAFSNVVLPQFSNASGSGTFAVSVAGNNVILTAVPEPSTAALALGGLSLFARRRRRTEY